MLTHVRKRDGRTLQEFDREKIKQAVSAAWVATRGVPINGDRTKIDHVVDWVVTSAAFADHVASVEQIQDVVEVALMRNGAYDVAKSYVLYRQKRAELRGARLEPDPKAIADYIHPSKYGRYLPEKRRRETYLETVDRVEKMHFEKFSHVPGISDLIVDAFDAVRRKEILPSMRSMQFAGEAIRVNNARLYNCAYTLVDRPRAFAETMWLLLSGCGVGYSVQFQHVEKLPVLVKIDPRYVHHHKIADSIEGWADALDTLVCSYMVSENAVYGSYVEFDFSGIRAQGSPLRISGGKAPGHLKLKQSLQRIREILDTASGRQLRPIEVHDVQCHSADAVLSGGIRRSAMISLFSIDDGEMAHAKTGKWYELFPWRANSNNSAALLRGEVTRRQFGNLFRATKQYGEPGFVFVSHLDYGVNPCAEIGLYPVLHEDGESKTGWAFCNLCEINAAKFSSADDFREAARRAAIIGTLQASYTSLPYLGHVSEEIAKRDALLGVSMTGMMASPIVALDPQAQLEAAAIVLKTNCEVAKMIGINPTARGTTVKPAGTTTLLLGIGASGIHPEHARRYVRRVVANEDEISFLFFRDTNPHMCVKKSNGDWVIEFPVQAPDSALLKDDFGAVEFLEKVKSTFSCWVGPGTQNQPACCAPDGEQITHNVSNTVIVQADEWDAVEEYLWENQTFLGGVSLIAHTGDKDYAFAPHEAVVTEADEARWNHLVARYRPVDYSLMIEDGDGTAPTSSPACEGPKCEMPQIENVPILNERRNSA